MGRGELRFEDELLKVLLFGKNGQVGWELQRSLAPLAELVALDREDSGRLGGELADPARLATVVREVRPDVIVNAAAHTAVDQAESEPDLARAINATAPGVLAREAAACGAWLVHYSTDYVFSGEGSRPWTEDDPTGPLNVYGQTKLEGERLIHDSGCRYLIFRTSWVFGSRGNNFARTMLRLAGERDSLTVVDDQHGAPTGADLLADVTAHVITAAIRRPAMAGTYHVAASGETTWHGYASHVIEFARAAGRPLRVTSGAIHPVPSTAFATAARRPANSRLSTDKLRQTFGLDLPDWKTGVERMLIEVLER
jgi:dTDP-4-dehydrorhamnose reductase